MNLPWSQGFYLSCQDVSGPLIVKRARRSSICLRYAALSRTSTSSSKAFRSTIATSTICSAEYADPFQCPMLMIR